MSLSRKAWERGTPMPPGHPRSSAGLQACLICPGAWQCHRNGPTDGHSPTINRTRASRRPVHKKARVAAQFLNLGVVMEWLLVLCRDKDAENANGANAGWLYRRPSFSSVKTPSVLMDNLSRRTSVSPASRPRSSAEKAPTMARASLSTSLFSWLPRVRVWQRSPSRHPVPVLRQVASILPQTAPARVPAGR